MYDFGALTGANDRYWALIRDELRASGLDAPDALVRGEDAYWPTWTAPDLLLSQTCGYPYRARLHGKVTLVGTPDFGLPDAPPGHYYSVFVVRRDDPRPDLAAFDGAAFAYNDDLSQSGWAAPQNHVTRFGLTLPPVHCSGGHRQSAQAVADAAADIAALDAVTWSLMQNRDPVVDRLRVIGRTEATPGLPYITANGGNAALLRVAIAQAIRRLSAADRTALHLRGIVEIPAAAYLAVPNPPTPDQIAQKMVSS